jgi:hypothetical protein
LEPAATTIPSKTTVQWLFEREATVYVWCRAGQTWVKDLCQRVTSQLGETHAIHAQAVLALFL